MAEFYGFDLKQFDTSTLSGAYQNLGTPLAKAARYVHVWNTSTVDAYISTDGVKDDIRIPAGKDLPIPAYTQHTTQNFGSYIFKKGLQLKIKQVTAAAAGAVIVNIFT